MVKRLDISQQNPHFDGSHEGPISDPLSSSKQMGIRIDADPQKKMNANPFHLAGEPSKEMKRFSDLLKGNDE